MKIGFIGCGNMARAMISGILSSGTAAPENILASAKSAASREYIEKELGVIPAENREIAAACGVIFLTVKPAKYEEIIDEIRDEVKENAIIVTVAPGKTLEYLTSLFGFGVKIIRTMPNTPAMVGEGMTGVSVNENVTQADLDTVMKLLTAFGRAEVIPEKLMDTVTAVSGSSPAYIFMVIEAMADGAVAGGMPRAQAYRFAAQAVLGSAKMVLESDLNPAALKDMVCSPAGTTIEAVRVLEQKGLRSALIEAELACLKKCRA